jgi:hypothetical protein
MKFNSAFFLFFIIGGFITAAAAVAYFASGVSYRGTDAENYTILLQIPLGIVTTLYGIDKLTGAEQRTGRE